MSDDATARDSVFGAILAGGKGERLWPLTRTHRPKPLLRLAGNPSLLAQSVARLEAAGISRSQQRIVGEACHQEAIARDLPDLPLLLEPKGFNTAHSVALAALRAQRECDDPILVVLPSDHVIADPTPLVEAIRQGVACARATRRLVVFGVVPDGVSVAYGHLQPGTKIGPSGPAYNLANYVEKPALARATEMSASGQYLWNCGNFVFPVRELLEAFRRFQPAILRAAAAVEALVNPSSEALAQTVTAYAEGPHLSIDHAIMEPAAAADSCAVIPVDFKRIDAGNLASVGTLFATDNRGNSSAGPALFLDSSGCFAATTGPLVVVLGLQDVVVTLENDVLLVAQRGRAADVRQVLAALRANKREDLL